MHIVIIGNSAAGVKAVETIRRYDSHSKITMISKEEGPAYSRVLLPYYLREKINYDGLFFRGEEFYDKYNVDTIFNAEVTGLNEAEKSLVMSNGEKVFFDKLLIATGSSPMMPPIENLPGSNVYNLWDLNDALAIQKHFKHSTRVFILGSGFISIMAAWAAFNQGLKVTVAELLPRMMPQVLDEKGSEILQNKLEEHDVSIYLNSETKKIERKSDSSIDVYLDDATPFNVDLVIVGTGVKPNTEFLKNTNLNIGKGIIVNNRMETNIRGIYAAGDVAQGPSVYGGAEVITPLWSTATEQGTVAGANIAGQNRLYQGCLNMNVVQFFGVTLASMGKFQVEDDCNINTHIRSDKESYVKLLEKDNVPLGGIVMGDADLVPLLASYRPYIMQNKICKNANLYNDRNKNPAIPVKALFADTYIRA